MKGLGGSHIDSISKSSNDKSGTVTKILVSIPELSISNLLNEILLVVVPVSLELRLPLEVILGGDLSLVELVNNISGVSIHSDKTHNLLSKRLGKISLNHNDQVLEKLLLVLKSLIHGTGISLTVPESLLDVQSPLGKVDQKSNLSGILLQPGLLVVLGESFKRVTGDLVERRSHDINNVLEIVLDLSQKLKWLMEVNILLSDARVHTDGCGANTLFLKL